MSQVHHTSQGCSELVNQYCRGPAELRAAVTGLTRDQLLARPVPGKWSTMEVLCHIADTEQFFADRMKRTIAMSRPLLLGAEGSIYPLPLHYHDRDLAEELAMIDITRAQMGRILHLLDSSAWQRTAVHSEVGLMTLEDLVRHAVDHLAHHLRFIHQKRDAL